MSQQRNGGVRISESRPLKILFWTLGIAVFLAFALLDPALRHLKRSMRADEDGTATHRGVATVAELVGKTGPDMLYGKDSDAFAQVRFNGKLYPVRSVIHAEGLKVGEAASILYRVGRSGRIYVDTAEPIAPADAAPEMGGQGRN